MDLAGEKSQTKRSGALFYVRPWSEPFFRALGGALFPAEPSVYLSEFRGTGDIWIGAWLKDKRRVETPCLSAEETQDVIVRCRFLRTQRPDLAKRLVDVLSAKLEALIIRERPRCIIGQLIDNYVMDVLERLAVRHGISYLSPVNFFLPGYIRLTHRGEYLRCRNEIDESEVVAARKTLLAEDFHPPYHIPKRKVVELIGRYAKQRAKAVAFPILSLVYRDPHNSHWNGPQPFGRSLRCISSDRYFSTHARDANDFIYMPLHYFPEATVEYWTPNQNFVRYEETLLELVKFLAPRCPVVLKEHPALFGWRDPAFYEKILSIPGVELLHPAVDSLDLVRRCRAVVTWTGTVGAEALLRDKPLFTLGNAPYSDRQTAPLETPVHTPEDFEQILQRNRAASTDVDGFLRRLLHGAIQLDGFAGNFRTTPEQQRACAKQLAGIIRRSSEMRAECGLAQ